MAKRTLALSILSLLAVCVFSARGQSGAVPVIVRFDATPSTIQPGQSSALTWIVQSATTVTINGGVGTVALTGSTTISPAQTTTYTLTASNSNGSVTANATVTVTAACIPQIIQFVASPQNIVAGQTTTLSWLVTCSTTITLSSIGSIPASGSVPVAPAVTTTYTLRAANASGSTTGTATVQVTPAVFVDRKTVDFGTIPVARQAGLIVNVVAPPGVAGGSVTANVSGSGDFSVRVPTGAPGGSGARAQFDVTSGTITPILVSFAPSQTIVQQASLIFTLPGQGGGTVTSTLSLRGAGVAVTGMEISAVVNAANSSSGVAPGTWVAIYGEQLSTTTRMWTSADFQNGALPASLDGVEVRFNGVPGYVYYVSPQQVNALIPVGLPSGELRQDDAVGCWNLTVQIKTLIATSNSIVVSACKVAPALFRTTANNQYYAAAVFPDGTLVGPSGINSRPAMPGETISVYATGLGPATPPPANPDLPSPPFPIVDPAFQLWINGQPTEVLYQGQVGPGEYQINVIVPSAARNGDIPIEITPIGAVPGAAGAMRISDALFIAVRQ